MSPVMEAALAGVGESVEDAGRRLRSAGFVDGLPVVPPTLPRVRSLYEQAGLDPLCTVAAPGPALVPVTIYDVAVNAVMAGCEPAQLPLLVAAVEAAADPRLNLRGNEAAVSSGCVALLVNGPAARHLQISAGAGCLTGSSHANAAIGRGLQLALMNLGGAGIGRPAKMGRCFAENEEQSPWPPFHTERGLGTDRSAVTLFGISGTVEVAAAAEGGAEEVLQTIARSMTIAGHVGPGLLVGGGEPLIVLGPGHATILAGEGFDKAAVRRELWRRARLRLRYKEDATRERIEAARR
jgi:hypothetical protein